MHIYVSQDLQEKGESEGTEDLMEPLAEQVQLVSLVLQALRERGVGLENQAGLESKDPGVFLAQQGRQVLLDLLVLLVSLDSQGPLVSDPLVLLENLDLLGQKDHPVRVLLLLYFIHFQKQIGKKNICFKFVSCPT